MCTLVAKKVFSVSVAAPLKENNDSSKAQSLRKVLTWASESMYIRS